MTGIERDGRGALYLSLLVFACTFAWLLSTQLPLVMRTNHEVGDFAANSLLIQDAKHLRLFVGNYSRTGVNHPGPAFLYALAAGESVLFDVLHVVPSPFSGQLVAFLLLDAAWLGVLAYLLIRMAGAPLTGMLAWVAFVVVLALFDAGMFGDIWFPDLYVFPFAVFAAALVRLATGRSDALVPCALAAGFLIHGNVSQVVFLVVMTVGALACNAQLARTSTIDAVFGRSFIGANRTRLVATATIVLLFIVPFAIASLVEHPSPIKGYLAIAHRHRLNKIREAFTFTVVYWGGWKGFVAGIVAAVVLWARAKAAGHATTKATVVVVAAATVAMFVYARNGVDLLDMTYIGLFYVAVPALLVSQTVVVISRAFRESAAKRLIVAAMCAVALGAVAVATRHPSVDAGQYDDAGQPALARGLATLAGPIKLVVDVDMGLARPIVWQHMVGLALQQRRRGEATFCIDRGWHILFTARWRCTDDDRRAGRRLFVTPSSAVAPSDAGRVVLQEDGLSFVGE